MCFVLSVMLILSLGFVFAGWSSATGTGTQKLNGISCYDATTCWAVGENGVVLYTSDGENWATEISGTTQVLNDVFVIDENIVWAVGENGVGLKRTVNLQGVPEWKTRKVDNSFLGPKDVNGVHMINGLKGFAVGESGKIWKTTTGLNWNEQTSGISKDFNDVYFITDNVGWVVGNLGKILITENGGATWTEQTSGVSVHLNSVYFFNPKEGFVVGDSGRLLSTENGGMTWSKDFVGLKSLNSIYFADANNGLIVGSDGKIHRTKNGGTTWTEEVSGATNILYDVYMLDADNAYAVGSKGKILKYSSVPSSSFNEREMPSQQGAFVGDLGGEANSNPTNIEIPCTHDDDCPSTLPYCWNSVCVECRVDSDCATDFICTNQKCKQDFSTTPQTTNPTCVEDDGGLNLFQAGTAISGGTDYKDVCVVSQTSATTSPERISTEVHEYVCNENILEDFILDCPSGTICEEGACVFSDGSSVDAGCDPIRVDGPRIPVGTVVRLIQAVDLEKTAFSNNSKTSFGGGFIEDDRGELYYCNHLDLTYQKVKANAETCLVNYECKSNSCLSGKCVAVGEILEGQMSFLTRIWCAIANPIDFMSREEQGGCDSEEAPKLNDYCKCLLEA